MAIFGDQKVAVIGAELVLSEFSAIWLQVFFGISVIVFDEKVPKTPNLALRVPFVDFLADLIGFDGISSTRFRGSFRRPNGHDRSRAFIVGILGDLASSSSSRGVASSTVLGAMFEKISQFFD